jgi:hypothetical protein
MINAKKIQTNYSNPSNFNSKIIEKPIHNQAIMISGAVPHQKTAASLCFSR